MRPHRRIPIYWPVLLTAAMTFGGFVAPASAGDEGDAVPPADGAVVIPDLAPASPAPSNESAPDAATTTTEPTETAPPADSEGTPAPSNAEVPTTTVPNAEPDMPPTTQPSPDLGDPATTVPNEPQSAPATQSSGEPTSSATTVSSAMSEGSAIATPTAEQTPPSRSVPAPETPTLVSEDSAAPSDVSIVPTAHDQLMEAFAAFPNDIVRHISFPVLGPVVFSNDWGACRDECTRLHEGTDVIGVRMQPLLAAVDGTVTHIGYTNAGTHGVDITVTGADGWYYNYFHVNNDTPGTDDGAAGREWEVSPLVAVGSRVRAGQVIAYMGDSGNAEGSVAHLHFEIREPDHTPVNPYPSLVAARARQTCSGNDPGLALSPDVSMLSPTVVAVTAIDGRGRWLIDANGQVYAEGSAAWVARIGGMHCEPSSD